MQIVCKYMKPHVVLVHDTRRVKADGKYPVKVRVTFNRKQKYYPTNVDLSTEEWERVNAEKVSRDIRETKAKLFGILAKAHDICNDLKAFTFPVFEKHLYKVRKNNGSLEALYEEYIEELKADGRIATATSYQCSLNSIKEFKSKINLEDVTVDFLKQYEKWMLAQEKSITTVGIYLRPLRALYNIAVSSGIASADAYPFGKRKYEIPAGRNVKKALTLADVGKIFKYKTVPMTTMDKAKDFWLFTYFCNGINMKDIALLKYKDVDGDFITFVRSKTEHTTRRNLKTISIYLTDEAKAIISKWGNPEISPDNYLFPIVRKNMTGEEQYAAIQQFTKTVNKYMKDIAIALELGKHVTTYTARHTFSTVLKRSGASIEFISEALGHSNKKTTESYLDSFEKDTQKEFAKKLLEF